MDFLKLMILKTFGPEESVCPYPGAIYIVYYSDIQRSSALKLLGKLKPNFMRALLGSGNESVYKWSRSHDQDIRHGYKYQNTSKILFFRTRGPMILKLGMKDRGEELYKFI